jgi:DNA-binding NtrC family response regulator
MQIPPPTVLIADDEDGIRELLKISLTAAGCHVIEAADGTVAIDLIRQSKIDIVVSDMMMPEVSGIEILEMMRAEGHQTPFILVTSYGAEEHANRARDLEVFQIIQKPFDIMRLADVIRSALPGSRVAANTSANP